MWIAQTGSPPAAPTWSRPAFFAAYRASAARSSTSCNASSESSKERTPVEEARLRRREAGKASVKLPQFQAINIVLGNLKTALCGTDHPLCQTSCRL